MSTAKSTLIRPPAVAKLFYSGDSLELASDVSRLLSQVNPQYLEPKALIVPHAGYIYSGKTAASGYKLLSNLKHKISKVVLLGPCHRVAVNGMALPDADYFATPLGDIPVNSESAALISNLSQVSISQHAHQDEHSLEVQLPFLQTQLVDFTLTPIVVGKCSSQLVAEVIEKLWGEEETLIVISSDLSHFLDYQSAIKIDKITTLAIEQLNGELISADMACGSTAIKGLLKVVKQKRMKIKKIAQCNSGDTAGDKNRVVGYASYAIY